MSTLAKLGNHWNRFTKSGVCQCLGGRPVEKSCKADQSWEKKLLFVGVLFDDWLVGVFGIWNHKRFFIKWLNQWTNEWMKELGSYSLDDLWSLVFLVFSSRSLEHQEHWMDRFINSTAHCLQQLANQHPQRSKWDKQRIHYIPLPPSNMKLVYT